MYKKEIINSVEVFYREAGIGNERTILLLHGFPTSSHMFRGLIPLLAKKFHVIAPDLPGFGPEAPSRDSFHYSFDNLKNVIYGLTDKLNLETFSLYVFDFGAPVGFRLAIEHPEKIEAIISQNGNIYEEGLGEVAQQLLLATEENRDDFAFALSYDAIKQSYFHNDNPQLISPDAYNLDEYYMNLPGRKEIQLDLIVDYHTNVAIYPKFQEFLREYKPKVLAVWGKGDAFFTPEGAEAFKKDVPDAEIHLLDAGHFALESHTEIIANYIHGFFEKF
ncbi:alpha/beta fold hydrolase [Listeria booriae]|uniref:alpha/beta fold hydrolase n=1 Tax=Listeria booriae TaxID=1552123 RepID=UPI0028A113C5|nr:alpha/beta hydrolase [Listeria booriae]